ncbi:BON domain-containing protein [Ramlibacter sp.]|uniref:BON domain-containing protein n=1 Tax=Ramlibacter sp. TaxID=1917967 RepID=UPI002FCA9D3A
MKADAQIKEDVAVELAWDPAVDSGRVGVAVKDGVVTVSGTLPTYMQKWAVERAVRRVAGVRGIALDLEVSLAPGHKRNDTELAQAAIQSLGWHTFVPPGSVRVEVEDGWVTLSGEVEWLYQSRAAERAVEPLAGVRGVTNEITVRTSADSQRIRDQIMAAFTRHAHREASRISIEVDGGIVTLKGRVDSLAEHDAAIGTATAAPGVSKVVDRLGVGA